MMWISKDKNRGFNIDLVVYWEYMPQTYLNEPSYIDVWIGGEPRRFEGDFADEIHMLLTQKKELLKG